MAPQQIYQFKVTLEGIEPPIWRRFQVPSDITFGKLHDVLQTVMGWEDGHLHLFEVDGATIADTEMLPDGTDVDEHEARLVSNGYKIP